ncbi:hypothetical protein D4A92_09460 [Rhizobium rosettiformans]|uniref:Uncharacterized protein n=1 Tax=Rhizobium rosettiformans TaxID=1368430 RepID=A0ABX7ETJ3_9HYPH|nr:hypothetical protein [Rhizobium rosettiformans]QRF51645.1 hypothetical protein D4A92_09460 [Rhizobium rosettiformans]
MNYKPYRMIILHSLALVAAVLVSAATRVAEFVLAPMIHLVRDAPVAFALSWLPRFKAVAFAFIGNLKPVYRESLLTNGQSLDGSLRLA